MQRHSRNRRKCPQSAVMQTKPTADEATVNDCAPWPRERKHDWERENEACQHEAKRGRSAVIPKLGQASLSPCALPSAPGAAPAAASILIIGLGVMISHCKLRTTSAGLISRNLGFAKARGDIGFSTMFSLRLLTHLQGNKESVLPIAELRLRGHTPAM